MKILALDTETGGFSSDRHALTQLALVACTISAGKAEPVARLVHNVHPAPGLLLEDSALEIQGHTRASLMHRPDQLTEAQLIERMKGFLASLGEDWECAPFVAHNGKFDHGFLEALCRRTSTPLPARDMLCTVERHKDLARRRIINKPENNKLKTLVQQLGLIQGDVHDAGLDSLLCANLFAWQEVKLATTQSLMEDAATDPIGIVYKHLPAATDGWWTKGPEEYPAKPHEAGYRRCNACGEREATWFLTYRIGVARNSYMGPVERFYACGPCKQSGASPGGLSSGEMLANVSEWKYCSPTATDPRPTTATLQPAANGPTFSCSKALVDLHRRAKEGELPPLSGWQASNGPIEDANRFVTGTFSVIRNMLQDLERINGAVIGTEKGMSK